ncbi:MAG: sugar ABC transporter ATP-binding protein, partial [Acidimicrobiia bacterium]|nr:sugar ABC transporter ATP-binding protein [Acidimicrobiia bacterium]
LGLEDLDKDRRISDIPLETLRLIDLARTLSREPDLLVLDEMTAALPANRAAQVFDVMSEHRDKGRSVLFITHRLSEVRQTCDRATVLRDGRNVATLDPRAGDETVLVEAMLGVTPEAAEEREDGADSRSLGAVALRVTDLRLSEEVRGVSFELREGEILGIAALEGQGQDRLFSVLSGDRRPSAGTIMVGGEELRARSPYDAVRRGVVLIPADRLLALLPNRSVTENVAVPFYIRIAGWFRLAAEEPARVAAAVDRLSIDTRAQSQVRRLSGGNQQKVVIGRWLAAGFRTLLCFDPTRGIDIGTKNQIYGLLRELAAGGAAILLYTSELAEIPLVCDRVLVMYRGTIVDEVDGPSATEEELLAAAHGLEPVT